MDDKPDEENGKPAIREAESKTPETWLEFLGVAGGTLMRIHGDSIKAPFSDVWLPQYQPSAEYQSQRRVNITKLGPHGTDIRYLTLDEIDEILTGIGRADAILSKLCEGEEFK